MLAAGLDSIAENTIKDVGATLGRRNPQELLSACGLHFTLANAVRILECLEKYAKWFKVHLAEEDGVLRVHLHHSLNRKWSLFLSGYVCSMFNRLGLERTGPEDVHECSVSFKFRLKAASP